MLAIPAVVVAPSNDHRFFCCYTALPYLGCMQHGHAVEMLSPATLQKSPHQQWADLGCGNGTFTLALAELLPHESTVYAMDIDQRALRNIPADHPNTKLIPVHGNFVTDPLPTTPLHGILLANALHFVKDQQAFIEKAIESLFPSGSFILVEYDTTVANPWGPYPVGFERLKTLFRHTGFSHIDKLAERPSIYNKAMIYAAQVRR